MLHQRVVLAINAQNSWIIPGKPFVVPELAIEAGVIVPINKPVDTFVVGESAAANCACPVIHFDSMPIQIFSIFLEDIDFFHGCSLVYAYLYNGT